nr:MAG TPA: hypothetical protein [Caudoviricetes sp.]
MFSLHFIHLTLTLTPYTTIRLSSLFHIPLSSPCSSSFSVRFIV